MVLLHKCFLFVRLGQAPCKNNINPGSLHFRNQFYLTHEWIKYEKTDNFIFLVAFYTGLFTLIHIKIKNLCNSLHLFQSCEIYNSGRPFSDWGLGPNLPSLSM